MYSAGWDTFRETGKQTKKLKSNSVCLGQTIAGHRQTYDLAHS